MKSITIWNAATGQLLENAAVAENICVVHGGELVEVSYEEARPEIREVLNKRVCGNIIVAICEHVKIEATR